MEITQHVFFILLFNVAEISRLVARAIQDVTAVNVHWARLETLQSNSRNSWLNSCFAFEEKLICKVSMRWLWELVKVSLPKTPLLLVFYPLVFCAGCRTAATQKADEG